MLLRKRPDNLPKKTKSRAKEEFVEVLSIQTQTDFNDDIDLVEGSFKQTQTDFIEFEYDDVFDSNVEYEDQKANLFDDTSIYFPNLKQFTQERVEVDQAENEICNEEQNYKEYRPKHVFSSHANVDQYFKSIVNSVRQAGTVEVNCNLCKNNGISCNSKMKQYYRVCKCKIDICDLKFKINKCNSNETWIVAEKGCNIHAFQNLNLINKVNLIKSRGIIEPLKLVINKYLQDDKDITAKRIFIKVIEMMKKPHFSNLKENSPSLKQVIDN